MRMVCEPRNTNTSNNGHRITRYRVFINWTVTDWAAVRFSKSANLRLIREIQCIHHEIAALSSFCIRTVSIWLSVFSSNSLCFNRSKSTYLVLWHRCQCYAQNASLQLWWFGSRTLHLRLCTNCVRTNQCGKLACWTISLQSLVASKISNASISTDICAVFIYAAESFSALLTGKRCVCVLRRVDFFVCKQFSFF